MQNNIIVVGLLFGFFWLGGWSAHAMAQADADVVHKIAANWHVQRWTVEDGLPVNGVTDFIFGTDGFLYLTTFDGLVRFDGERFVTYNVASHPELPSNRFKGFHPGADGELLIATEQGELVRFREGRFTTFEIGPHLPGRLTFSHDYDPKGKVHYFGTTAGLVRLQDSTLTPLVKGVGTVQRVLLHRDGTLHFMADNVYYAYENGSARSIAALPGVLDGGSSISQDAGGRVWVGSVLEQTLYYLNEGRWHRAQLRPRPRGTELRGFKADAAGTIWVTTNTGIYRQRGVSFERVPPAAWPGALPDAIACTVPPYLVEDSGGNLQGIVPCSTPQTFETLPMRVGPDAALWGATSEGLVRLSRSPIQPYFHAGNDAFNNVYPVLHDRSGRLWVGSFEGVACQGEACPIIPPEYRSRQTLSLHEDAAGQIWAGHGGAVSRIGDTFETVSFPSDDISYVRALDIDDAGRLWIGKEAGLMIGSLTEEGWQFRRYVSELTHPWVRVIRETKDGMRWLGTNGGGLMRVTEDDDGLLHFEPFTTAEGLCSDNVRDLYEDAEGIIWVATEDAGLCRVDLRGTGGDLGRAQVTSIRQEHGLFQTGIHNVIEDDAGRFWMGTNRGLFWVTRADLEAFAEDANHLILSVSYTEAEGLLNRELNGGSQPSAWKDREGILWFASQAGVIRVDPIEVTLPPPPVAHIERVYVEGETRALKNLTLRPGTRDLTIAYTSAYFGSHDHVNYRYRLVGYDAEWQQAREVKEATYTNLPPGRYQFEVQAGLGSTWASAAMLAFERKAFFYETTWFLVALVVLALGMLVSGVRWRLRKAEQQADQLREAVALATSEVAEKNAELVEVLAGKENFLANLSHEIRTPLTLIQAPLADVLAEEDRLRPATTARLKLIQRNAQRLLRLFNQLLDHASLTAGQAALNLSRFDLARLCREQVQLFSSTAEHRGITLRADVPVGEVPWVADEDALQKVVANLLSNALKFTDAGGMVTVSLTQGEDGAVRIQVSDTGDGIAHDQLPHVFERFFQADAALTRQYDGTGIGLSLVQMLTALHDGEVHVESVLGKGSTFTVSLPVLPEEAIQAEPVPVSEERGAVATSLSGNGDGSDHVRPFLLIVEDNEDLAAYLKETLNSEYRVITARNGVEALAMAQAEVPDIVLSDVMMPGLSGLELCQGLREDLRTSHIPIVLLTARASDEHKLKGFEAGADAYLQKPFNVQELRVRLAGLLRNRARLQQAIREGRTLKFATDHAGDGIASSVGVVVAAPRLLPMDDGFITQIEEAIVANYSDSTFDANRLAEVMALSERQLRRKVQALMGETPATLLRLYRLEQAERLLRGDTSSVKEVAYKVGFSSSSHFSRLFKQHYGAPPSEYTGRGSTTPGT